MPSTSFAANTAGIIWSPPEGWQDTEESGAGNVLVRHGWLGGCQVDFTFTGTACTMDWATVVTSGLTVQVSIDGGAFTTLALPGSINTFTTVTLATGLADANHTVTLKHSAGNGHPEYFWIDFATAFTVTGSAPAILSTMPSGFGNQYDLLSEVLGNGQIEGPWQTDGNIAFTGTYGSAGYNYIAPPVLKCGYSDGLIRFKATPGTTAIKIWAVANGAELKLWKDGAASGSQVTLPTGGAFGWQTLASGLDGNAHEYGVINTVQGSSVVPYFCAIMLVGGSLNTASPVQRRGAIVWVGDSILEGFGTGDSTTALAFQVCAQKNYECVNVSISGSSLLTTYQAGCQGGEARAAEAAQFTRAGEVNYVVLNLGHNDGNAVTGLVPSTTDYQTVWQNNLARYRATFPNATIYVFGYYPTSASTANTNRTALNTAAAAAVAAMSDAKILYHSTDGVIVPATDTTDGTHPNSGGYTKMVTDALPLFTIYTPPLSGTAPVFPPVVAGTYTILE